MQLTPTAHLPVHIHGPARARAGGFTLIELLTVISIIAILAGLTFGGMSAIKNRAMVSQAKAELSVLATALESYKRAYGDYPWAGNTQFSANVTFEGIAPSDAITATGASAQAPAILFNALMGRQGPRGAAMEGKALVEQSKFKLAYPPEEAIDGTLIVKGTTTSAANCFVDPWGRPYYFFYKTISSPATWTEPGFILFSAGLDGKTGLKTDPAEKATDYIKPNGTIVFPDDANPLDYRNSLDNIYYNR